MQSVLYFSCIAPPTSKNCIPDLSKDKLSLATVSLVNASEYQFNNRNETIVLRFSCPILDIYNYSLTDENNTEINTLNTTSEITIADQFQLDKIILSLIALDEYGLPLFISFDLYFGNIDMPVRILYPNGSAASGVFVQVNLTDSPSVSQSGYTDENGSIIFTNVPSQTISLFARTTDNQIALGGIAPTTFGVNLTLIPFGDTTSKNIKIAESLNVKKSAERFLHTIKKRDIQMPGFTITTNGIGLQIISRTYSVEKNHTSISIRYKFITAEVPGGYFGSRFNDYFSVTIRSSKGLYKSISQSMNALGLGAFDYASGATDWYVLKLPLNGESDLIQIDVGVANVGDGAFQSTVTVDEVSIETCNQCDGCTKCPTGPMCLETCANPPEKSCLFYTECMEAQVNCGFNGYALGYGNKYCRKYNSRIGLFSVDGQNWIYKTMNCLQKALVTSLEECHNCQQLRTIAFDSHPKCYTDSGVCNLPVRDYVEIFKTVGQEFATAEGIKQAGITFGVCVTSIVVRISAEIKNTTENYLRLQLYAISKFFESISTN